MQLATSLAVRRQPYPVQPDTRTTPVVYIVDDDVSVRESLELLVSAAGWQPVTFATAAAFLAARRAPGPSCLVLDVSLPDLGGLELQARLAGDGVELPIVFVSGYSDVATTVRAMKAGAAEFMTKPLGADALVDALAQALERSRAALAGAAALGAVRARYASLSQREREVMALVTAGLLNKQVGGELHISEITVKAHRGRVMRKMQAASLADLVNMAAALSLPVPRKAAEFGGEHAERGVLKLARCADARVMTTRT